jgi:hypothetical protein
MIKRTELGLIPAEQIEGKIQGALLLEAASSDA